MVDRIQLILKVHNLTASRFADEIGVQRSAISHILSGRNMPSLDLIQKVLRRYPEISPEWLLSGAGSMHKGLQPDLFSVEPREEPEKLPVTSHIEEMVESDPQEDIKEQIINEIDVEKPVVKPVENVINVSKTDSVLENPVENPLMSPESPREKTSSKKNIEKIVIFYSDQTFREYFPESL